MSDHLRRSADRPPPVGVAAGITRRSPPADPLTVARYMAAHINSGTDHTPGAGPVIGQYRQRTDGSVRIIVGLGSS